MQSGSTTIRYLIQQAQAATTLRHLTTAFGLLLIGFIGPLAHPLPSFAGEHFPNTTVVKVQAHYPYGKVTKGSAVLLGSERLVTNCHVTAASQDVSVVQNGRAWRAEIEAQDTVRDLCIFRAPGIAGTRAHTSYSVTVGRKVFAMGFFGGNPLTVTEGRIVALHDYDGAKIIQVSAPFDAGASGGGLFDEHGQLIGILTFKARIGGPFHFALPVEWVSRLQRQGGERNTVATTPFWQQPPEQQPFFLRAMTLEVNQKWDALAVLSERWTQKNPLNLHAWMTLETAFRNLKRLDEAMLARSEAQRLGFVAAREELVKVHIGREGNMDTEHRDGAP
jgi:serine protease Do